VEPGHRPLVLVDRVSKRYGRTLAVAELSFGVARGEVLGFLGPNGAGKTTTMRVITGFMPPTEGRVLVGGLDIAEAPLEVRRRIGYLPENPPLYPEMEVSAFLEFAARLRGVPRSRVREAVAGAIERSALGEARDRIIGKLSRGYRQRVGLAQALVHDPDLLCLDEPTNGMDPRGREEMLALVRDLAYRKDVNVIVSSHLLPDVEATCEHVLVMHRGSLVAAGPIAELKGPGRRAFELRIKGDAVRFTEELREAGADCHDDGTGVLRVLVGENRGARDLFALAATRGVQVRHLRPSVPTLEDVFAQAIGETDA